MKTVLIIAGSDPGAGAGLQQDLKVATLLGAYGLTVPTALTVQNSLGVQAVHPVAKDVVAAQLDAILDDFPVAAVKLGMLATRDIVTAVAARLRNLEPIPVVLDPVLAAGGGFPLLDEDGIAAMLDQLFPLTTLLTPNAPEAARLTGMKISSPADLEEAARRLQARGPRWVLAKGGHLTGEPVDILTDGKNAYHLPGTRLTAPHQHGTGCLLASAAACYLAQGLSLPEAVNQARRLTRQALKYGLPLGHGSGPVNPYAPFARDRARFAVLEDLRLAAARLQAEDISPLIPEVMTNLGFAAPYPEGPQDVAAFPGRLVKSPSGVIIPAGPAFGASRHVAAIILTALATHPELRSAMNIKFVTGIEDLASLLHLRAASFDRTEEPADVKRREGGTLAWGVASVLQAGKPAPDIIYDRGDFGKEGMIRILGPTPMTVAEKALAIKNALQAGGNL
ncbi:MAG: bifunctional hydroxymethylpyrimidine kinase/phosphomethylpyrimidine kinase [Deltaproteobacteria bacterium]|nr:bifunctional hydroxymethylpyrimidine kinase/phosphomethylpyrimidine kinase [Deltaproteobacteria bacterium]